MTRAQRQLHLYAWLVLTPLALLLLIAAVIARHGAAPSLNAPGAAVAGGAR